MTLFYDRHSSPPIIRGLSHFARTPVDIITEPQGTVQNGAHGTNGKDSAERAGQVYGANGTNGKSGETHVVPGINGSAVSTVLFEHARSIPDRAVSSFDYMGFLQHLHLQGGLVDDGRNRHPDAGISQLCKGLAEFLVTDNSAQFTHLIERLSSSRHLDPGHLVDLIARVVQFIFRSRNDATYVNFSAQDWQQYFTTLNPAELQCIHQLCGELNVSTHVLSRYRGMAWLLDILSAKQLTGRNVVDIGCSANLGSPLALIASDMSSLSPALTVDTTPHQLITQLSNRRPHLSSRVMGIDIHGISPDWAAACAYFEQYDATATSYMDARQAISESDVHCETIVADITDHRDTKKILESLERVDIAHASMVLYQLSPEQQRVALDNIAYLLNTGGILIELTFIDPTNWFKPDNVQSIIRVKLSDGTLSEPFQWLIWNTSRCTKVKPGVDYDRVMELLTADTTL